MSTVKQWRTRTRIVAVVVVVATTLLTSCDSPATRGQVVEDPTLDLITPQEMGRLLNEAASAPGPLRPATPSDMSRLGSSARDLSKAFRTQAARMAAAARVPGKYELVPPILSKAARRELAASIARLECKSSPATEFAVDTLSIYQVRSVALDRLFPAHEFVVVFYAIGHNDQPGVLASGLSSFGNYYTAALPKQAGKVYEFPDTGNYQQFGDFLRDMDVTIKDESEAALVWDAFCAVHKKRWPPAKHVLAAPGAWKLHFEVHTSKDGRVIEYWYEVQTDAEGRVQRGGLKSRERPYRVGAPLT